MSPPFGTSFRQEVLSEIRELSTFGALRDRLQAFPDVPLVASDYERAAEFFNICRSKGVQGANTDFLICSVACRMECEILTTDQDFTQFALHLPIILTEL